MSNRADVIRAQQDANTAAVEAQRRVGLGLDGEAAAALLAVRLEIRALAILVDSLSSERP